MDWKAYGYAIGDGKQWVAMAVAPNGEKPDVNDWKIAEANAALICRAVNSFDALVAALKSWVDYMDALDADHERSDPLAEARRLYHGKRMAASRAALALAAGKGEAK